MSPAIRRIGWSRIQVQGEGEPAWLNLTGWVDGAVAEANRRAAEAASLEDLIAVVESE